MSRARAVARGAYKLVTLALGVALGVALVPFLVAGIGFEAAVAAFQHGRQMFRNIDSKLGKP
jgi:hypothetical protein